MFDAQLPMLHVGLIALACGLAFGGFCRVYFGSFFIWGLSVGVLLVSIGWLITFVLPIKWALILFASIALPLAVFRYVDESSLVHSSELRKAANDRGVREISALFENDPDAAQSLADALNSGIEYHEDEWPEGSPWRGIPRRVLDRAIAAIAIGYAVIIACGLAIFYLN